ncbi:hypothetical protein M970_060320 [Encephalitozoon cuniculi EcunIII-L]|uniref:Disintegrin and metalloproteinase domain-containing protein B n=1 Tax=Encephalitozoon cuniculi TaxID=6035 RepID=M1KKA1_ENCCN|nr:zinc metallopeptidase [Encephalitozoon cuniculi]KMV65934.1 hypothetical protein M970_060320 [Encephalitozoon cuniculi EcunIII-L]UYI27625.1 hypothetical protein J0A71_07g15020 [Encephalitozoon cuniculi]
MLLFAVLALVSGRAEEVDMAFTDPDGKAIPVESIPSSSDFVMAFMAFGRKFRLRLSDSSLKIGGVLMRQNLCDFSIACLGEEKCYGSASFCNSIHGLFVSAGTVYQIRSAGAGKVRIEDLRHVPMDTEEGGEGHDEEGNVTRVIKVFLINDFDRVQEMGPDINLDTVEIFRNAKDVFEKNKWNIRGIELSLNGILNAVDRPLAHELFSKQQELDMIRTNTFDPEYVEKVDSIEMLRTLSRMLGTVHGNAGVEMLLEKSNLVLLLQTSSIKINGLTFVGGMGSAAKRFGIIKVSEPDSYFYKGKVLAHEIAHALGAEHEEGGRCLMREEESPLEKEESAALSHESIEKIESFISRNESKFGEIDTCGNGIMDGKKECDAGLPNGSVCCTSKCKLRAWAQCDDRNGRCCKDCGLLPKNTVCRVRTSNIHKMDCERESYCDGKSPACRVRYASDGARYASEGICKKGILQTEALMCERVGRFSSPKCLSRDGRLWCLDQYDVCLPVFTSLSSPIMLPDFWNQRDSNSAATKKGHMILLMAIPICLLVVSRFIASDR